MSDDQHSADARANLEESEEQEVSERRQLSTLIVYEAVRREGVDELSRPMASLAWSGLTGGAGMGFSLAAEGVLHASLPDAPWRPLVESFGYSTGFLIVILSRHQLFTENTITAVLPVLHSPSRKLAGDLMRLWTVVFLANMVGAAIFAAGLLWDPILPANLRAGMIEIAGQLAHQSLAQVFWRAIPAGWLVATLVWMLPSAEAGKIWVIIILTYLISVLSLTHVVAGAVEIFLLTFHGDLSPATAVFGFVLPMLVGNVIGGSALFAMLSFGQVKDELT